MQNRYTIKTEEAEKHMLQMPYKTNWCYISRCFRSQVAIIRYWDGFWVLRGLSTTGYIFSITELQAALLLQSADEDVLKLYTDMSR